jgi:tetratricopeptide (TPR) repeat protein
MVAGGAAGLAVLTGVGGRAPGVVTDADGGARGRLDEWRVAVRVVARHPLAGVGPEGYRIAFGGAVDDAYEQAHGRDPLPDRAHDALLDVAVTTGLPGVLAYVLLLAAAGAFAVRALLSSPPWVAGMAAGVLAYAAQSLFLFPVAELEPVAWLLAGIVASCVARPGELTAVRAPRALPAAAAGLAAVALVAGVLDLVADRDARTALVAAGAGGHAGPGHPRRAARLRPDAVRYRLVAARALEARGSVEGLAAAVATLDTALSLSPRDPVVRSERARLLLERARRSGSAADVAAAREALERLGSADPRNAQVLLRLGLGRQLAGDAAGAEHAWLRAERLAPRSAAASTDLALAYAAASRWSDARAAALRALAREPADDRARQVLQAADGT